ncbi:unnamed protein product [Lampetra fluviatilis]
MPIETGRRLNRQAERLRDAGKRRAGPPSLPPSYPPPEISSHPARRRSLWGEAFRATRSITETNVAFVKGGEGSFFCKELATRMGKHSNFVANFRVKLFVHDGSSSSRSDSRYLTAACGFGGSRRYALWHQLTCRRANVVKLNASKASPVQFPRHVTLLGPWAGTRPPRLRFGRITQSSTSGVNRRDSLQRFKSRITARAEPPGFDA